MKAVLRALAGVAGASWALVHFIRRLPTLTAEEISRMEELNPKTPDQFREDDEIRRFLAGAGVPPATQALPAHERSHQ